MDRARAWPLSACAEFGFDIAILVPFTKTPIVTYLYDIGLRYLDRHAGEAKREPGSQRGERIALLRSRIGFAFPG